jgi:hypothetical protein
MTETFEMTNSYIYRQRSENNIEVYIPKIMNKTIVRAAFIVGTAVAGAFLIVTSIASAATLGVGVRVSAQANVGARPPMMGGGVFGTVSAINGTTLTITSKGFAGYGHPSSTTATPAPTTYTVDAASATITKGGASSTISSIAVGDSVVVRGTVSGTNIAATAIFDGVVPGGVNPGGPMRGGFGRGPNGSSTGMWSSSTAALFQGNGEPVVGGTVTAISGATLTVTNKSNITYTIDGSTATVVKGNATSSLANVAVNDNVLVQGAVSGTNVTAATILDQGAMSAGGGAGASASAHVNVMTKMFGGIGAFFQHLFGFF